MAKTWGTPTWYFFHSLAENVDKNFYKNNSETIKKYIINICSNLPCHECTKHAKSYLNKHLKNRKITNKEELKKFLFDFHNEVNVRLKKPRFEDIDYYKNSNLLNIYKNFKYFYTKNNSLERGFSDSLSRRNLISNLDDYFKNNSNYFKWHA